MAARQIEQLDNASKFRSSLSARKNLPTDCTHTDSSSPINNFLTGRVLRNVVCKYFNSMRRPLQIQSLPFRGASHSVRPRSADTLPSLSLSSLYPVINDRLQLGPAWSCPITVIANVLQGTTFGKTFLLKVPSASSEGLADRIRR